MELEQSACQDFRSRCQEAGLLQRPAALHEDDALDGLNDETTLWRFLRADKFDALKAFSRYQETCATRAKTNLLRVYEEIDVDDFEKARVLYPHWSGRRDKRGNPICLFDISKLDSGVLNEYATARTSATSEPSAALLRSLAFHDSLTRFVLPLCTAAASHGEAVTSCIYLVDVSKFSIRQAWNVRSYAQDISKLLANDYPEMIDKVLVIGAPRYFNQIWKIVKGWIDPVTAAKIEIMDNSDILKALSSHIDAENIPKQFGGTFDFTHGMLPRPDAGTQEVLDRALPDGSVPLAGPFKWKVDNSLGRRIIPVGSVKGTRRGEANVSVDG